MARVLLFRHYNALPIDPSANFGFSDSTRSRAHEHNGHQRRRRATATRSAFYFPGQFYDYHWPMVARRSRLDQHERDRSPKMAGQAGRERRDRSNIAR